MAITTPNIMKESAIPLGERVYWSVNNDENDGTPAVTLKAAPGDGYSLYITHITISGRLNDVEVSIGYDAVALFGPIQMQSNGNGLFSKDFRLPIQLPENEALLMQSTDGEEVTVYVEGFTVKDKVQ